MLNLLRGLAISRKFVSKVVSALQENEERLHRLEIKQREILEALAVVEEQQTRLTKRWAAGLGGRPPKGSQSQQLPLDEVPHGDKAALRRALAGMKHN